MDSREVSPPRYSSKLLGGGGRINSPSASTGVNSSGMLRHNASGSSSAASVGAVLQKYGYRGSSPPAAAAAAASSYSAVSAAAAQSSSASSQMKYGNSSASAVSARIASPTTAIVGGPPLRSYRSVRDGSTGNTPLTTAPATTTFGSNNNANNSNTASSHYDPHLVSSVARSPLRSPAATAANNNNSNTITTNTMNASVVAASSQLLQAKLASVEAKLAAEKSHREDVEREKQSLNRKLLDLTAKLELTASNATSNTSLLQSLERQQAVYDEDRAKLLEQHKATVATIEAAREQLTLKNQSLLQELERVRREAGERDDESINAKRAVNDLQLKTDREKLTLESHLQVLQGQIAAKTDEANALQQQVMRERELREQESQEGDRLRERIEALSRKLLQHENNAGQQSVEMATSLRHQQEEFEAKLGDLRHQLAMEGQRKNREILEKEAIQRQLDTTREEVLSIRNALLEEKKRHQEAKMALADSQQFVVQCEAKELEIRRLAESNDVTREHLNNERRTKEAIEARIAYITAERDNFARAEEELRREISDHFQPQIRRLQNELTESANVVASLRLDTQGMSEVKLQLDQLLRSKERVADELAMEKERARHLEDQLSAAKQQIIEANRTIETQRMAERNLSADLRAAGDKSKDVSRLEDSLHNAEQQIESLTRAKEGLEKQAKLLESSLKNKDDEMDGLVRQLAAASSFQAQSETLRSQLDVERSNSRALQSQLEESRDQIKSLASELADVTTLARETQIARDGIIAERNNYEQLYREQRDKHFLVSEKLEEAMARLSSAQLEIEHRQQIANEIPYLRQQIESLSSAKREQQDAAKDLHEQITEVNAKNVRLQLDNEELSRRVAKYNLQSEATERQLTLLQEELTQVTSQLGALQVQYDERDRQCGILRTQVEALTIKTTAQEEDKKALSEAKLSLTVQLDELSQELLTKSDDCARWERKANSIDARVQQLDEMNAAATKRIAALEADNRILADTRNSISTLEGTIEGQQKLLNEKDRERQTLEAEIARLRDCDAALHSAEAKNSALTTQIDDLRRALQKRELALQEQDHDLATQSTALSRLQASITTEQRNVTITKDALAAAESQIDDLLRRLQKAEEKAKAKGAAEGKLEGTQRVLDAAQQEITELKSRIMLLEDTNKTLQKEHDTVLPQLRREVKELRVHSDARQELFDSVQKELDERIHRLRALQKESDEKQSQIHDLTQRCSELDLRVRDTTHQLERAALDSTSSSTRAEENAARQRELIRNLKDEVSALRDDLTGAKESITALQRDLSRSQGDAERYKAELGKSEHNVGKLSVEVTMLRAALEDKNYAHDHSVSQLAESKESFYKTQQTVQELKTRLDAAEHRLLVLAREKMDEEKAKAIACEAYEKQIEGMAADRNAIIERLAQIERAKDEVERKLFAVSAEKSSLQAQLVTTEAATNAHKEAVHKEIDEKQRLILQKGEAERMLLTLETKIQRLESELRVVNMNLSVAAEEVSKQEAVKRNLVEETHRRDDEHKFQMDVTSHRLRNLSIERDEAISQRTAAQIALIAATTAHPTSSTLLGNNNSTTANVNSSRVGGAFTPNRSLYGATTANTNSSTTAAVAAAAALNAINNSTSAASPIPPRTYVSSLSPRPTGTAANNTSVINTSVIQSPHRSAFY